MTQWQLGTNDAEAERIENGTQNFVIRKLPCKEGDIIRFDAYRAQKKVRRLITTRTYRVTYVACWDNAPVEDGNYIINIKEI